MDKVGDVVGSKLCARWQRGVSLQEFEYVSDGSFNGNGWKEGACVVGCHFFVESELNVCYLVDKVK